jgi:hypothetical protein
MYLRVSYKKNNMKTNIEVWIPGSGSESAPKCHGSPTLVRTVDNTLRQSCDAGKRSGFIWVIGPDTDPDPNSESEFRCRKPIRYLKTIFMMSYGLILELKNAFAEV